MNKKLLKFASMLLVAVCLCMNFASCGDDDDEKKEEGTEQDNGGNGGKDDVPIEIFQKSGTENGYAYVDLGLPSGLKWSTCNVGAENPWDYGDYFAWGETTPKSVYYWNTYLDGRMTDETDCGTDKDLLKDITDIADTQYDAARANMGGSWQMPTLDEKNELIDNCYWEWTDSYNGKGVAGYIVYKVKDASDKGKKKNGSGSSTTTVASYSLSNAHIFLPASGYRSLLALNYAGSHGGYWSSSLISRDGASDLGFSAGGVIRITASSRYIGQSVRGVCK